MSICNHYTKDFGKVYMSASKDGLSDEPKWSVKVNWSSIGEVDINTAEEFSSNLYNALKFARNIGNMIALERFDYLPILFGINKQGE